MHRLIAGLGPTDSDRRIVDHRNRDRLDNRRANLRICDKSQNGCNRVKTRHNTSGLKGVSYHRASGRWRAAIGYRGKARYLGIYPDPESAHEVYCLAADMLHGSFANYGHS
ncbi:HNH endonuclease [Burkholderia cepacia]|uniref:HNH endonuclease n=1 Tax=Burkholderia cepacia TaxID=292 RepID=UPI0039BED8D1